MKAEGRRQKGRQKREQEENYQLSTVNCQLFNDILKSTYLFSRIRQPDDRVLLRATVK
ncbi:MAG: hypothetical protein HC849_24580 [Oscillatoriales cyanobacterium RU_3_3]|nr:hypothetical protein [Microcoleus sp. SM1_3_4]NJM62653.1 hypothetical protein [Oscillatoriales cyanobacterium RU_3_3]NJR22114.1 hypothetical protein [Richelia sp. CSU_2_1]